MPNRYHQMWLPLKKRKKKYLLLVQFSFQFTLRIASKCDRTLIRHSLSSRRAGKSKHIRANSPIKTLSHLLLELIAISTTTLLKICIQHFDIQYGNLCCPLP